MLSIANPEPVKVFSRVSECVRRLMEDGLSYDALQFPIDDSEMRERLINYWLAGAPEISLLIPIPMPKPAYESTPSQVASRIIMGKNFLGIEEVMRHYGAVFTAEQLAELAEIPFSEAEIEERKNTHLLVAYFPGMSVLNIRAKAPNEKSKKAFRSYKDAWYNPQAFATSEKTGIGWAFVRKTAVEDSFSKAFTDQTQLLRPGDEVPRACEFVYAVVLYFMVTGERLFQNVYVRCSDIVSGGGRVFAGFFADDGLGISDLWGDGPHDFIGLASVRKFKKKLAA